MPPSASPNKWLVTVSVSCGTFMGALDSSIVNVALPQIRGSLGATLEEITWASTGFIIATVVTLPFPGFFGRLFGQKRAYLGCLALFIVGSFLCGIAWNLPSLVLFRVLQGLGAGVLQPTEQAILRQTFPPEEQGMAMAIFTSIIVVGPAVGPTLGGYIVDNFHWSWIFFINLPVGALGFLMVWRFLEDPEDVRAANQAAAESERRNIDWIGITLMCVSLTSLQYVLEEGQRQDWFDSPWITAFALLAGVCVPAFVLRELTAARPVVHLRLFKDPKFTSGSLLGGVMFFILIAGLFLLSLFMQEILGFTAEGAGLVLMPRALVMMVVMPIIGRLYTRLPPRLLLVAGLLVTGLGVYQMSRFSLDTSAGDIVAVVLLQGLGSSLLFVPLNTVVLDDVPRHRLADGAGLNSLMRQIGSSLGLALFTNLLARYTTQAQVGLSAHLVEGRPEVMERLALMQGGLGSRLGGTGAGEASLRLLAASIQRQAAVLAFDQLFALAAVLFLVVTPLLLFLRTGGGAQAMTRAAAEANG